MVAKVEYFWACIPERLSAQALLPSMVSFGRDAGSLDCLISLAPPRNPFRFPSNSYFALQNISTLRQGPISRMVSLFRFVDVPSMWLWCVSAGALTFGILSDSWPSFRDVSRGER